ncbi:MAG TPA: methyltransferase domain-containing protein [Limnochordia bacterium]
MAWTADALRERYDQIAAWYDAVEGLTERLMGVPRLRQRIFSRARGSVLEVAAGTGANLPHYPPGCEVTLIDLSPGMLARARRRAERLGMKARFELGDAQALPFEAGRFDTVASSLTLCTFPDPLAALSEMRRVCRGGGRILLLEHGRSDRAWLGRWQDAKAERHARHVGCYWNREPLELVRQAGLTVIEARRYRLGTFHTIEAAP